MNVDKAILKLDKFLHREVRYPMRETAVLGDLQKDVLQIEALLAEAQKNKNAALLVEYYGKEAASEEKLSERLERRLERVLEKLLGLAKDASLKLGPAERTALADLIDHIEIIKNNLIRIISWNGELHQLVASKKNWKMVKVKIDEALGDDKHLGIRSLIVLLKKLEEFDKEMRKLEGRRKFLKTAAIGSVGGMLALRYGPEFLQRIEDFLTLGKYQELRKHLQKDSIPWNNQVQPKINVELPKWMEKSIHEKLEGTKEIIEGTIIDPLQEIMEGDAFDTEDNAIINFELETGSRSLSPLQVLVTEVWGAGTVIFSNPSIRFSKANKRSNVDGLILTAHHTIVPWQDAVHHIHILGERLHFYWYIIISSQEIDFTAVLYGHMDIEKSIGLRFTTSLHEREKVYIKRHPDSPNFHYGAISEGVVVLKSYFTKELWDKKSVDLSVATFKAYIGDIGSPVFNRKGEVVGILVMVIFSDGNLKKPLCSLFVRTEYIFNALLFARDIIREKIKDLP